VSSYPDQPSKCYAKHFSGFRALCYLKQGRCRLISRNGNLMSRFDGLGDQIAAALDINDAMLDGEVIATDETVRPQFYDHLRRTRAPVYVAFDILWVRWHRSPAIAACRAPAVPAQPSPEEIGIVAEALSVVDQGCHLFDLMCAHDLEGIIAKRRQIRTRRASGGSRSRTRTTRRRKAGASCSTDHHGGIRRLSGEEVRPVAASAVIQSALN
jgi:bifunctional non-homologous end joining protein LigD